MTSQALTTPGSADARGPAAADNAAWCAAVAAAHGTSSRWSPATDPPATWSADGDVPRFFPTVVTLRPGLDAARVAEVAARSARGTADVAVKDAFADVDLAGHGFRVLLHGRWFHSSPDEVADAAAGWSVRVVAAGDVARAFAAVSDHLDWAAVQRTEGVDLLAVEARGEQVATAVRTTRTNATGLSCVTPAAGADLAAVWRAIAADGRGRGVPVVAWEAVDDDEGPPAAGLRDVGPLRVWVRSSARTAP